MVYLTARLAHRTSPNKTTLLRLPTSRRVREHIRNWHFPQALTGATGMTFRRLVDPRDHSYFGEREGDPASIIGSRSGRLPPHYFPIRTFFALSGDFGYDLLIEETSRWQSRYVLAVLNQHLRNHGRRVATHVIYEAIVNAIRHPKARILQTGSSFQASGSSGHLTLVIWDDGESIIETLRAGALRQGSLMPHNDSKLHREFILRPVLQNGVEGEKQTVRSDSVTTADTDDHKMLLAAFFPGVTSRPDDPRVIPRSIKAPSDEQWLFCCFRGSVGSYVCSIEGQAVRPGRGGQQPPLVSMAMAMSASGEWNP